MLSGFEQLVFLKKKIIAGIKVIPTMNTRLDECRFEGISKKVGVFNTVMVVQKQQAVAGRAMENGVSHSDTGATVVARPTFTLATDHLGIIMSNTDIRTLEFYSGIGLSLPLFLLMQEIFDERRCLMSYL